MLKEIHVKSIAVAKPTFSTEMERNFSSTINLNKNNQLRYNEK